MATTSASQSDLAALAASFVSYAETECPDAPMYAYLAHRVAKDDALLRLTAVARAKVRPFDLLFAAVHYLLLGGVPGDLARWYPTVPTDEAPQGDPFPAFLSFCMEHREEVAAVLAERTFQVNEVHRCTYLLPALALGAAAAGRPLALVDVGASAGLNLLFDRFHYRYSNGAEVGDANSAVHLECRVVGSIPPPVPAAMPPVAARLGIDIQPIGLDDPDAVRWLRALVLPERAAMHARLDAALRIAAADPPTVLAGDALELLPDVVAGMPAEAVVCVHHAYFLHHLPPAARHRYVTGMLPGLGAARDLVWLPSEVGAGLHMTTWLDGTRTDRFLARHHPAGIWVEWHDKTGGNLAEPSARRPVPRPQSAGEDPQRGARPDETMKKLLVASIYGPSPINETWRNLQRRYLNRTVGERNYDQVVWLNRVPQALFDGIPVQVLGNGGEGTPDASDHLVALQRVLDHFRAVRHRYEHFLILDSDAFPFRQHWIERMLDMMQPRSWTYRAWTGAEVIQVGVPERRVAAIIQAENLDVFYHPSAVFVRGDALREDPSCVGFRVERFRNMAGLEFPEVTLISKVPVLPLMRTNHWNAHPLMAGVYGDVLYHHSAGTRIFPSFRAIDLGCYPDIPYDAHRAIQNQLLGAISTDADSFLSHLTGDQRFAPR